MISSAELPFILCLNQHDIQWESLGKLSNTKKKEKGNKVDDHRKNTSQNLHGSRPTEKTGTSSDSYAHKSPLGTIFFSIHNE